nr:MAG TPA: hypothetical protein [Caudoviricetes sp.]
MDDYAIFIEQLIKHCKLKASLTTCKDAYDAYNDAKHLCENYLREKENGKEN